MKKILHVISALDNCGTERYLINLLKGTCFNFKNIIITYNDSNYWKDELEKMGVKVYYVCDNSNFTRMKKIMKIIKKEDIDIVYSYTFYNSAYVLLASFFSGVKNRITHSHRSSVDRKVNSLKIFACKLIISILSTHCLACSEVAGKSLFLGFRRFKIINNCIDINQYNYNEKTRRMLRKKLKICDDTVVFGTIGRIDNNKNQKFLIDLFIQYHANNKNSKLIIIGDGVLRNELTNYVNSLNLTNDVLFLGNRNDANMYYNVFDLFFLTSYNEGLPFVLIEAQANGLSCIVSDCVTKNANINGNVFFASLKDDIGVWLDIIEKCVFIRKEDISKIIDLYSLDGMYKYIIDNIYK